MSEVKKILFNGEFRKNFSGSWAGSLDSPSTHLEKFEASPVHLKIYYSALFFLWKTYDGEHPPLFCRGANNDKSAHAISSPRSTCDLQVALKRATISCRSQRCSEIFQEFEENWEENICTRATSCEPCLRTRKKGRGFPPLVLERQGSCCASCSHSAVQTYN